MNSYLAMYLCCLLATSFLTAQEMSSNVNNTQQVYIDKPFTQEYAVKYKNQNEDLNCSKVYTDRNGVVKILGNQGLQQLQGGHFLYPGLIVEDNSYRTMSDKNIKDIKLYNNQFVYLDDEAIFSNGWAGSIFYKHSLSLARKFVGGTEFDFLIASEKSVQYLKKGKIVFSESLDHSIKKIAFNQDQEKFYILAGSTLYTLNSGTTSLKEIYSNSDVLTFSFRSQTDEIIIGMESGYLYLNGKTYTESTNLIKAIPSSSISSIEEINGNLWFGTPHGVFMLREDGSYNYYKGGRWLVDDNVVHISGNRKQGINILTETGLSILQFENYTLADKAAFYDKQVRQRHLRLGFNATLSGMERGNLASGYMSDSDNDGLWTSMYLAAEIFRYKVTQSGEALQNVRESFAAMERLYSINDVAGFPSRSYERSGYINKLSDPHRWQHSSDEEWDWKSTTSSDEAIGHIFAFAVLAELIDDHNLRSRAIHLIDILMDHIVQNDFYLVDYDGKPTQWGKWNPSYVNKRPSIVGDRKLNSSNITSMLQTAYHFTKKEVYKNKLLELHKEHGYFDNLMKPMDEIGMAPASASDWDKMLSENWNHSDDEMYFLGYWGLYRYPMSESLLPDYKKSIVDHWQVERPEKDGLWNIMTYITGDEDYDLDEAMWYLREYPLDLITWNMKNSHRKDITFLNENFRQQSITTVLPPDELPITRHNANRFRLDGGRNGTSEYSAGDIWLLPYWMGRYLGLISSPVK